MAFFISLSVYNLRHYAGAFLLRVLGNQGLRDPDSAVTISFPSNFPAILFFFILHLVHICSQEFGVNKSLLLLLQQKMSVIKLKSVFELRWAVEEV